MNLGQYKAELAMSRLVSKYLHSRVGYCYENVNSIVHSMVHSTIQVHFPVQHRGITYLPDQS